MDAGIQGEGQVEAMRRGRTENANTLVALRWLVARARAGVVVEHPMASGSALSPADVLAMIAG